MKGKIVGLVVALVIFDLVALDGKISGGALNTVIKTVKWGKSGVVKVVENGTDAISSFIPKETVYVEKPVEKIVYVDKPVEKVVYVDKPVEKVVYVDKPVEKIVYVDKTPKTVSGKEKAKDIRTKELNGILSAFPQYEKTLYGTDDERYEIETFANYIYKTYVKAYFSVDRDIYICCTASSKESSALAVQHAFRDTNTYNGLIVFFNSNKYDMWNDMLTSIRGDEKKDGDVSIPYKGKTIHINEWTMGTLIHEILHVAETYESYYPEKLKGNFKHHDCPQSLEAERQLGNNPYLKGAKIRYKECQAYNNQW